jgi:translocation and assembly module TamB
LSTATSSSDPGPPKNRGRWAKISAAIAASLAVLMLLMITAVATLLHSVRFYNYLLALAQKKASDALGTQVELQNFAIHPSNLSLDLYGVTVHGADPYFNPPLLLVQHVEVGVRVVSIWSRKWYLDNFQVDHPVARIFINADGVSNIPKPKSSGGVHTNIFELGIRHALLNSGEGYYNDRKIALEADLHDVDFRSSFDSPIQKYSGALSYRDGHLRTDTFSPISHGLDAQFEATPDTFRLTHAKLTSGSSRFVIAATLKDYSHPNIQAQYDAVLDGSDIRHILRNPSVPTGVIRTKGSVNYRYDPKGSVLNTVVLEGDLSSRQLNVQAAKLRAQVNDLVAHYSLANGDAQVRKVRARLLGGEVTGTLDIRDITGASQSRLSASLRGISLRELKRMAPTSPAMRDLAVSGVLNANANAAWVKSFNNLVAHTDATIHANVSSSANPKALPNVVPVEGVMHGTYSAATEQLALAQSYLRTPQTTLTMNGAINGTGGNRSGLAIQLKSNDLRELETVADLVRKPQTGEPIQPLGLAGTASFEGIVRGSANAPHFTGKLVASNLQVMGTKWRVLQTNVEVSPSLVSLQHADLEPASQGRITFNASSRLTQWSLTKESPIQVEFHASQIDVADLEKIAGSQIPVVGMLAVNISAHGTVLNPMGQGNISLSHAKVYDEPIQSANVIFIGADQQVQGKLAVRVASGTVQGVVSIRPEQKSYVAQLTANGIHLDQLQALKTHNVDANGVLNVHGSGQGTLDNPQFNATLQIPQLEIQQQAIKGITLQMEVANHVATANLNSSFADNAIKAAAKVNLTGDYFVETSMDTQAVELQPLLAMYAPSEAAGASGETEVHATLRGPLKNRKLLEAHATLPILKLNYGSAIQLAAASPIHIDYKNGVIDLQRAAIRGTDTDLQIQGAMPIAGHAPVSLLLLGTVYLLLAQLFSPDIRSSGELRFNINSYGARADPNIEGQVEIVNANFANGNLPVGLQHGNGVLTLTKDRLNIQAFKATVGGGTLTAQGGVAYRPSIQFDLGAAAKGIRMLYPQGVREEVDADLRLSGTGDNALLGGRVRIQNLSFTPDFDLMSFMGQLSGGVTPPPSQGFSQNLQLNLALSSINNLNLVSRALSVDGTANLQVRGTAAEPVILGRINLNDGDLIFNGNRFTLGGGTVEFINPAETQPVVNLALNTTIQQYNIHLRFNGPVDQLRTNYASDPALPAADIINLLAFGQTTEASAANPTPGNQAAMSTVASQVSSQITSRVAKVAGISQLSINPVLAGGSTQGPAGAIVTIQQRVTGNLFVTFSTNVTSTQSQVIMGQYRLSPRVSLSATRDQNGGFGFDTTFKKSW